MNTRNLIVNGYVVEFTEVSQGEWFAKVPALPGCMTEGDSFEDAYAMICDAMELWLTVARECGIKYAAPVDPALKVGVVYEQSGMGRIRTVHEFVNENASELAQWVYWACKNGRNAEWAISAGAVWDLYEFARAEGDKDFADVVRHQAFDPRPVLLHHDFDLSAVELGDLNAEPEELADYYVASDHGIETISSRFHRILSA